MRPFKPNKKYTQIAVYTGATIAVAILFGVFLFNLGTVGEVISRLISVLSPLLYGLMIAYLLRPLVVRFEGLYKKLFCKNENRAEKTKLHMLSFARALSILSALALVGGVIVCFFAFIFPLTNILSSIGFV